MRSMVEGAGRLRGDPVSDASRIIQNLVGRNSQHAEAELPQPRVARFIALGTLQAVMCRSVDLDDQRRLAAEEIRDIGFDRMLTAKLEAAGAQPQLLPEQYF